MSRKFFLPAAGLLLIVACNNSADESAKKADTATTAPAADTMAHMTTDATKTAPPVPAVPAGAKVVFKNLKDGERVSSPLKVEMGTEGIKVDTAGPVIAGVGHHHLFIDAEDSLPSGTMVPKDSTHLHFGKAQTQAEIKLTPGKHKLTLQLADGLHRSYGVQLSKVITVNVKN